MRDTNDDVPEVGVGARGWAAQGAGPRQDDGRHRHPRSQLNNILHFALNSLLWNFFPHDINHAGCQAWCRPSVTRGTAACTSSSTPSAGRWRQPTLTRKRSLRRTQQVVNFLASILTLIPQQYTIMSTHRKCHFHTYR